MCRRQVFAAPCIGRRRGARTAFDQRISGLVVEYIVAIDVTRVRFPADASAQCCSTFLPCVELAVGGLPSPVSEKQLLCLPGHRQRECASAAERLARKLGCARRTADTNAAGGFTQPGVASAPRQHTLAVVAAVSRPHWQALAFAVRAVRGADAVSLACPTPHFTEVRPLY